ncbi:MAG: tRNA (N6-threonylcarbamoyladenosine(37)-N6)-methyltransferase TrmO [Bdellovibrionales bacterium]|nr:tRNA (N6-threonylcarbamoyladenosine(37)-N6)-methyltransferase TrmO [Bdellovibrionales bacterium]
MNFKDSGSFRLNEFRFSPIGYIETQEIYPAESPRQPQLGGQSPGLIRLVPNNDLLLALDGLSEFSHIWVLFVFHHNKNWKPLIQPPRPDLNKKGVFASRAPYRPNPIGQSVVAIDKIDEWEIHFSQHDFLTGTPVLDIKPYIPYYDSIPEAHPGWFTPISLYKIHYHLSSLQALEFLKNQGLHLESVIHTQLSTYPTHPQGKRIQILEDPHYELAFRTWRIYFEVNREKQEVRILSLASSYTLHELNSDDDPYNDKEIHRKFARQFPQNR